MSLKVIRNPEWSGQPVVVGGVEVVTTTSEQESGVDAPTKSMERGAEISQRNVQHPERGTIRGAVDGAGLSSLRGLTQRRDPISITTPETTVTKCVVENVRRTREGRHVSKFGVEIDWRQVLIAELGSVSIQAVTQDGKSTSSSSSAPSQSLAGSKGKSTSSGPDTGSVSIGDYLGGIADTVGGWF